MNWLPDEVSIVAEEFLRTRSACHGGELIKIVDDSHLVKGVLAMDLTGHGRVVIKVWQYHTRKGRLLQLLGCSNPFREWGVHQFCLSAGIAVPRPLWFGRIRDARSQMADVMVVEMLDGAINGMEYLKMLLRNGDLTRAFEFDSQLIKLTERLLKRGVTDVDHQLNNMLFHNSQIYRIDFECARRSRLGWNVGRDIGFMLARLVCSHVYACQPDCRRSEAFARELVNVLRPSRRSLGIAKNRIICLLEAQMRAAGIDSRFSVPW